MMLIELVKDRETKEPAPDETLAIIKGAFQKGVIAMRAGLFTNGIRFLPPLTITDDQLCEGLDVIEQALAEVEANAGLANRLQPRERGHDHRAWVRRAPRRSSGTACCGRVATDPAEATALAVAAGRIVAVGSDDDVLNLRGPDTRVIDLGGHTLLPGFVDAHAHIWKIGHLLTTLLDLRGAGSLADLAVADAGQGRRAGPWRMALRPWLQRGEVRGRARPDAGRPRRRDQRPPGRADADLRAHHRLQQPGAGDGRHRRGHGAAGGRRRSTAASAASRPACCARPPSVSCCVTCRSPPPTNTQP